MALVAYLIYFRKDLTPFFILYSQIPEPTCPPLLASLLQCAALDFVLESIVEIVPSSTESLKKTKNLMKKYADLPMDFADATVVCLATETGIQNIVTFDKKDFAIDRLPKKKSFTIMP